MPRPLLLFDIDGTILRSGGAGMRAMSRVAGRLFGEQHKWDGIDAGGHLDPLIFAEFAAINRIDESHHDTFREHYIVELQQELEASREHVRVMPGILGIFDELRTKRRGDAVMGLLTGNYTQAVPLKLMAVGVEPSWFEVTAFGDEGRSRPDLVALAMRKYEALTGEPPPPKKVIVIGDTPRDISCAHAHDCLCLAVATGGYKVEQLRAAGADVAVEDLADPEPLWQML